MTILRRLTNNLERHQLMNSMEIVEYPGDQVEKGLSHVGLVQKVRVLGLTLEKNTPLKKEKRGG